MRKYVLNKDVLPPEGYQLLTWPYPYGSIVISRNFVVSSGDENIHFPDGLTSVLSAFPASYLLHHGSDNCGLIDLFSYCTENIDEIVPVPVDFASMFYPGTRTIRNVKWPCNISDSHDSAIMIMGSKDYINSSVFAVHSVENAKHLFQDKVSFQSQGKHVFEEGSNGCLEE